MVALACRGVLVKPHPCAQYVHQLGNAKRWVVAELKPDGCYLAQHSQAEPGGLQFYESRSLLDLSHNTRIYLTRAGALRAAKRRFQGES